MKKTMTLICALAFSSTIAYSTEIESMLSQIPLQVKSALEEKAANETNTNESTDPFSIMVTTYDKLMFSLRNPKYPTFKQRYENAKIHYGVIEKAYEDYFKDDTLTYDATLEVDELIAITRRTMAALNSTEENAKKDLNIVMSMTAKESNKKEEQISYLKELATQQKAVAAKNSSYEELSEYNEKELALLNAMSALCKAEKLEKIIKEMEGGKTLAEIKVD